MTIDYARHVTYYREKLGVSKIEFAALVGVTRGAVSCWESGAYRPRPETIAKIERLVGLHPGEFYRPLPTFTSSSGAS